MPAPIAYGIAIAATALVNWACGGGSDCRGTASATGPADRCRAPTPKPDSGNPEDADVGAGFPRPDAQTPDVFVPDATPRPDIRDVYIPPDTGPHQTDVGFTDSGLDAGTLDLGIMDAGRPPCNPANLEAFDGYDDNCNGNNNALAEMKRVSIFFEELHLTGRGQARKVIAFGDINNDGYGDLALGAPVLGAVWVYLGGRDSPQLTHYEPGSTITVKSNMGMGWGLELTSVAGQTTTLPTSRGFVIHEDYRDRTMGLGTALAVVPVTDPTTRQRYNELWIGAGAFNNDFSQTGNRTDTGAIFRLDARGNNPATRMVSHSIAADPVALTTLNMSAIIGEERQGPPSNPTRPGSILGSEIIPAGDVNGFPNGADEVVLPYFQQPRVAIVSALAVIQPSQRIQTIVDLLNQQGYLINGGFNFGNTDIAVWSFDDLDGDGKSDMFLGIEGDSIRDQGAGKLRILTDLNLLPIYPQTFDPTEDSTLPQNLWRVTIAGIPGNGIGVYGSDLGASLAVGDFDRDQYADVAVGATAVNQAAGALFTLRGSELRQQSSGTVITANGPIMGGHDYLGQNQNEAFTSGGIVSADTDGDSLVDFVAGTIRRGTNGIPADNGGLDLICGNGRMGNGRTMSSTVTQGSVTSLACERLHGPTGARIGRVNQNAVYDLNNDGTDEIGTCDEQAKCFVLLGGR